MPDEPDGSANLRNYYQNNSRYFWTLVPVFQISYYSHYSYCAIHRPHANLPHDIVLGAVNIAVALTLRWLRPPLVHYLGLTVVLALTLWDRSGYAIN